MEYMIIIIIISFVTVARFHNLAMIRDNLVTKEFWLEESVSISREKDYLQPHI
jgi:hypothetical protein